MPFFDCSTNQYFKSLKEFFEYHIMIKDIHGLTRR